MRKLVNKRVLASVMSLLMLATTGVGSLVAKSAKADGSTAITEIKILKKLKLPQGVTTPTKTFTFNFAKHSMNGKTEDTEKNKCPEITAPTVSYSNADTLQTGKTSIDKDATLTLTGINWPSAGQYTYTVTEANVDNDTTDTNYEGIYTKSTAQYLISFMVVQDGGNKKVASVYIKREVADNNDPTGSTAQTAKVPYNPTPSGDEENGFKFTNIYNKKVKPVTPTPGGGGTTPDEETLKKGLLLKKLANDGASEDFKKQDFRFKITVTKPDTVTSNVKEIYYTHSGGEHSESNGYSPDSLEFNLKVGETAALSNIYLGSTVTIEETNHQSAATATIAGQANNTNVTADNDNQFKTISFVLGESGNMVTFTNNEQTPTGVLLDNLPFILIAILALAGIYYFKRSHDKQKQTSR